MNFHPNLESLCSVTLRSWVVVDIVFRIICVFSLADLGGSGFKNLDYAASKNLGKYAKFMLDSIGNM